MSFAPRVKSELVRENVDLGANIANNMEAEDESIGNPEETELQRVQQENTMMNRLAFSYTFEAEVKLPEY